MKIDGYGKLAGVNQYNRQMDSKQSRVEHKANKKDEVVISHEAKELLGAQTLSSSQRIQQLKQEVSTGVYHVDAGKLAEKMLPYFNQ